MFRETSVRFGGGQAEFGGWLLLFEGAYWKGIAKVNLGIIAEATWG